MASPCARWRPGWVCRLPAMYCHDQGRQDLLGAVSEGGFSILEGYLGRAATGQDPLERVLKVAGALRRFALRHPGYFELLFVSPRLDGRRFPLDFRRRLSRTFQTLQDQVSRAMAEGAFRPADMMITGLGIWAGPRADLSPPQRPLRPHHGAVPAQLPARHAAARGGAGPVRPSGVARVDGEGVRPGTTGPTQGAGRHPGRRHGCP